VWLLSGEFMATSDDGGRQTPPRAMDTTIVPSLPADGCSSRANP
jgi:short subunit dehydrogenase-like uncharacterized protein